MIWDVSKNIIQLFGQLLYDIWLILQGRADIQGKM